MSPLATILLGFVAGIYIIGVLTTLLVGLVEYSIGRESNRSDPYRTSGIRLVRYCLVWPLLAINAMTPLLAGLAKDMRNEKESK